MTERITERITLGEITAYKREVLERSVLIAPAEVSRILACSPRKVYDLVRSGRLSGYAENRKSKGLRILAKELLEYVESLKIGQDDWLE
jgi:hypothetical protein